MKRFSKFNITATLHQKRRKAGQGLVEYAIILMLVGLAVVAIVTLLEPVIGDVFSRFVRDAPVAPPSLVNYTPPPSFTPTETPDPNTTNTAVPSSTATPAGTNTPTETPTETPTITPSPSPTLTPAVTSTPQTVSFTSNPNQDGYIPETGQDTDTGGTPVNTGGLQVGDVNGSRQLVTIVSFDTNSLPDNATVVSAELRLRCFNDQGTPENLGNLVADIKSGGFSGSASLQSSDFNAAPDNDIVAILNKPNCNNNGWAIGDVIDGLEFINTTGTTQFRIRFTTKYDQNGNDRMYFNSGASGTAPPQLIVNYTTP